MIDLRSDTVTQPTDAMRKAMYEAEVGDDCYGEDPTVNRLQELAAGILAMESALFVPSGTMANQIAVAVFAKPGGEVICEAECHLIHHESGACSALSGVQLRGLPGSRGILSAQQVRAAIRPDDPYAPKTLMVAVENTHNTAGGTVWPLDKLQEVAKVARAHSLPVICDGARLFNASVATGTKLRDYANCADVVTLSLYKGLCAPMGSLVCGPKDVIDRAWHFRRLLGGALRQAGVMAAAGIVGLETMVERLQEDHENAQALAAGLAEFGPIAKAATNMVVFEAGAAEDSILRGLRDQGILAGPIAPGRIRFVTHNDVKRAGIDRAISAFGQVVSGFSQDTLLNRAKSESAE